MSLSPREQEVLRLLRSRPMLDAQGIADLLGTSKPRSTDGHAGGGVIVVGVGSAG